MNKQFCKKKHKYFYKAKITKATENEIFTANVSNFMSYKNYTIFILLCCVINHEQKLQSIPPTIYFCTFKCSFRKKAKNSFNSFHVMSIAIASLGFNMNGISKEPFVFDLRLQYDVYAYIWRDF